MAEPHDADRGEVADPRVVRALESLGADPDAGEVEEPPAGLWDAIAAEAFGAEGAAPAAPAAPSGSAGADAPAPSGRWLRRGPETTIHRPALFAIAAAVLLGVVLGAAVLVDRLADRSDGPETVVTGELEPVGDAGSGTVEVTRDGDQLQLRADLVDLPDPDGYYEVWVGSDDLSGLVSLGPVRADGVYDLPAGWDPGAFPVVDVSDEPLDGDPAHSTVSVVRGTLV